jgi:hypothetical protein
VGEHRGIAVVGRTVEQGDRRGGLDRRLFGELDDRRPSPLPDDRLRAVGARLGDGRRRQLGLGADRQSGGVDGAVAVEEEGQFFEDRRQFA